MSVITFVKNESYKNDRGLNYEYSKPQDYDFVVRLEKLLSLANKKISWHNPYDDKALFAVISNLVLCLSKMLSSSDAILSNCYKTTDIFNKPMTRYILCDRRMQRCYLVDTAAHMDTSVHYSWWQRIKYKYFGQKIQYGKYISRLSYFVRIWTSPASYYQFDAISKRLNNIKDSNVQYAQLGLGLPKGYKVTQTLYSERLDYERRKELFRSFE